MNGVKRAVLLTHTAGDTPDLAGIHDRLALKEVLAGYNVLLLIRYEINEVLRAGLDTGTAGYTLLLVDDGNAIYDMDSIKLTCLYTGAIATAAERTCLLGTSRDIRKISTISDTGILCLLLYL